MNLPNNNGRSLALSLPWLLYWRGESLHSQQTVSPTEWKSRETPPTMLSLKNPETDKYHQVDTHRDHWQQAGTPTTEKHLARCLLRRTRSQTSHPNLKSAQVHCGVQSTGPGVQASTDTNITDKENAPAESTFKTLPSFFKNNCSWGVVEAKWRWAKGENGGHL